MNDLQFGAMVVVLLCGYFGLIALKRESLIQRQTIALLVAVITRLELRIDALDGGKPSGTKISKGKT